MLLCWRARAQHSGGVHAPWVLSELLYFTCSLVTKLASTTAAGTEVGVAMASRIGGHGGGGWAGRVYRMGGSGAAGGSPVTVAESLAATVERKPAHLRRFIPSLIILDYKLWCPLYIRNTSPNKLNQINLPEIITFLNQWPPHQPWLGLVRRLYWRPTKASTTILKSSRQSNNIAFFNALMCWNNIHPPDFHLICYVLWH